MDCKGVRMGKASTEKKMQSNLQKGKVAQSDIYFVFPKTGRNTTFQFPECNNMIYYVPTCMWDLEMPQNIYFFLIGSVRSPLRV